MDLHEWRFMAIPLAGLVWLLIWRGSQLICAGIARGSTPGILLGAILGSVLITVSTRSYFTDSPFFLNAILGPGLIVGGLIGAAMGAMVGPVGRRKDSTRVVEPDPPRNLDPRWESAVEHMGQYRALKHRRDVRLGEPPSEDPARESGRP